MKEREPSVVAAPEGHDYRLILTVPSNKTIKNFLKYIYTCTLKTHMFCGKHTENLVRSILKLMQLIIFLLFICLFGLGRGLTERALRQFETWNSPSIVSRRSVVLLKKYYIWTQAALTDRFTNQHVRAVNSSS